MIHAVTDDLTITRPTFLERARAVMRALGEDGAIHLRTRIAPARFVYDLALALAPLQAETGAWVVVNDRVDVALAAGCRAAQLTSASLSVAEARAAAERSAAPGALALGASVHAVAEARAAERDGASWVVAGHLFETASHRGEPGRGLDFVAELRVAVRLPVIVIGGVKPAHLGALRRAGVDGVAAISGIWSAENAEAAAREYLSAWRTAGAA